MLKTIFFLSAGLFLGWSLGANDAGNVFGSAVGTKMLKFKTAAVIFTIFVILGAVISGHGATRTITQIGQVNALAGAFVVTFATAFTVYWMAKLKLPVSTTQAIIGAIIGWNFFANFKTDFGFVNQVISTWVLSPVIAFFIAIILYFIFKLALESSPIHLLKVDYWTRIALIFAGAFGAYSLGASNIANVMGVFVPVSPFNDLPLTGSLMFSKTQILFLIGSIAIAVGVWTYSKHVMMTVGSDIFKLSPICALIVVLASSSVLFLFASESLRNILIYLRIPVMPLVPISSTQTVIGAVLGIGIVKSRQNINFGILAKVGLAWLISPIAAGLLTYFLLFIMQNVFLQTVFLS